MTESVALIGFGEAGHAFARDSCWPGGPRVYDRLTDDAASRSDKIAEYQLAGVAGVERLGAAITDATIVISLVTADQALAVVRSAARYLAPRALFCDMNSVAPATKREAAAAVEAVGGRYVDVAIMSPVSPAGRAVPLLLSGRDAAVAVSQLNALGFKHTRVVGAVVGQASAIKMIRSVMVKGIEALTAECMLAAEAAGVIEEVLCSLDGSERTEPWARRADYNLDRMIVHGLRRADEMDEVVRTLEELGVDPVLSRAAALRQREIGALAVVKPGTGLGAKIDQIQGNRADRA